MIKNFILLLVVLFVAGCADKHQLIKVKTSNAKLDSTKSIYIAVPKNGSYGNINYQGSGQTTAQIILLNLSKYSNNVEIAMDYQSYKDTLVYSSVNNFEYLIFTNILEWEDRATEWSGLSDRAAIKINVIEVKTGKTLDSVIIEGKSGLATFGGDHPQDLLYEPIKKYIDSQF